MAVSITAFPGTMPSLSDPANFNTNALALFDWIVNTFVGDLEGITGADLYASIVGTVHQSGGEPTGALFEAGSNSNGQYTRFADGTQLCWINEHTLAYINTGLLAKNWSYPAAFTDSTKVMVVAVANLTDSVLTPATTDIIGPTCSTPGGTAIGIQLRRITGGTDFDAADTATTMCFAIGRWF